MSGSVAAERRELELAGWEPRGKGAKTIWRSPAGGRWYAHYQAVEAVLGTKYERLLGEHDFERVSDEGTPDGRERWVRLEEGPQLYERRQAQEIVRMEEA